MFVILIVKTQKNKCIQKLKVGHNSSTATEGSLQISFIYSSITILAYRKSNREMRKARETSRKATYIIYILSIAESRAESS